MGQISKEIEKIYCRRENMIHPLKILGICKIIFWILAGIFVLLTFTGYYISGVIAVIVYLAYRGYALLFMHDEIKLDLLDYQLAASFVVELRQADEFGTGGGSEFYYIFNELIMHENMVREEGSYKRSLGGVESDTMVGPVTENLKKTMTTIRDPEFREQICTEINRGHEEYQGWNIKPIDRVFAIRPGIFADNVLIAGKRGMREKIKIARDLEDRKELLQKFREMKRKTD